MKLRLALLSTLVAAICIVNAEDKPKTDSKNMPKPEVVKTEEDWKKLLTLEQFEVTRMRGTERPNGAAYAEFEKQGAGTYYCVCCGAELFTSKEKFHSGCGWPSFYDSSKAKGVLEKVDPTDRRFCINGVALKFVPQGGEAPKLLEIASDAVQQKKDEVAKEGGVEPKK
jgi:peptide-methionine (R)-S-oxide reductase